MTDEASHTTQDDSEVAGSRSMSRKLQLVRAGASQFGVFADEIATIVAWRQPTPLPQAPKPVLGVVSVQGRILTVLDLALLTGGETAQSDSESEASGDAAGAAHNAAPKESDAFHSNLVALRGDEQLALAVADVGESIELVDGFAAQPENGKLVLQRDGAQITILNPKELFPTAIQGRERRRRRF
jgi:chemotaxis signal transduction protein